MNRVDAVWKVGGLTIGSLVRALTPLRNYGVERVPREGHQGLLVRRGGEEGLAPAAPVLF